MRLQPHLHLLLPSSDPSVQLEARVYLPVEPTRHQNLKAFLSTSSGSAPLSWNNESSELRQTLGSIAVDSVITASHPWGKLGGNMLDPVLADYLVDSVFSQGEPPRQGKTTALATFNIRGVGRSGGSLGWLGLSNRTNEADFAKVEQWAIEAFSQSGHIIKEVHRVGYSWGTLSALRAPMPDVGVKSIMLISPPVGIFGYTSVLTSSPFRKSLLKMVTASSTTSTPPPVSNPDTIEGSETTKAAKDQTTVWLVHGTRDTFTGAETYRALGDELKHSPLFVRRELEGAGHFYRSDREANDLTGVLREWWNKKIRDALGY